MAQVRVVVIDPSLLEQKQVEVPDSIPIARLAAALVQRMGLPSTDNAGQPISYRLGYSRRGSDIELGPEQTLAQAGIQDDDVLRLYAHMQAGCFLAGTEIAIPAGSRVPIETLKAGDEVISYDIGTGLLSSSTIKVRTAETAASYLIVNRALRITATHPVYSGTSWTRAGDLRIGSQIFTQELAPVEICSLEHKEGPVTVYNLHLSGATHNFFADGILVHNGARKEMLGGGNLLPFASASSPHYDESALNSALQSLENVTAYLREAVESAGNRRDLRRPIPASTRALRRPDALADPPSDEESDGESSPFYGTPVPSDLPVPRGVRRAFARRFLQLPDVRERFARLARAQPSRISWEMRLRETRPATPWDYACLFTSLDRLYTFFYTLSRAESFFQFWVQGRPTSVSARDELLVAEIGKQSPLVISGTGLGPAVRALSEVFSIGKQIEDIRKANINVAEAHLELRRKELQFKEEERRLAAESEFSALEREIIREKRRVELAELRAKRRELERQQREALEAELEKTFVVMRTWLPVLQELPGEIGDDLKEWIRRQINAISYTAFEVEKVEVLQREAPGEDGQ